MRGLRLVAVAHLIPSQVSGALSAVVDLVHRDTPREPPPAVVPLDRAGGIHEALENRTAPAKTVLSLR